MTTDSTGGRITRRRALFYVNETDGAIIRVVVRTLHRDGSVTVDPVQRVDERHRPSDLGLLRGPDARAKIVVRGGWRMDGRLLHASISDAMSAAAKGGTP